MSTAVDAALARCAAAVAVEALAHSHYGALGTPAAAFMGLALSGVRRLVVGDPNETTYKFDDDETGDEGRDVERDVNLSVPRAVQVLAVAPLNVSSLVLDASVATTSWPAIVAALDVNRCHAFMRRLNLHEIDSISADGAAALLTATNGLAHLRSLQCAGAGVETLLNAVGNLRRLALPECSAIQNIPFSRLPLLRRVGPVWGLPDAVTALDLSSLQHLVRVDAYFGVACRGLREVRLPPSVTSIGDSFLEECGNLGVLDLSNLTQLRWVGDFFAQETSIADVRLPPSVAAIGDYFLYRCTSIMTVLDFSHLTKLQSIGTHFSVHTAVPDVNLPHGVVSIGDHFLESSGVTEERRAALLRTTVA
jgi:hypothetical protein